MFRHDDVMEWFVLMTSFLFSCFAQWSSTLPAILQHHGFVSMIVRLMQKVYISQADIFQQCCHLLSVYCKQQEVEVMQVL